MAQAEAADGQLEGEVHEGEVHGRDGGYIERGSGWGGGELLTVGRGATRASAR